MCSTLCGCCHYRQGGPYQLRGTPKTMGSPLTLRPTGVYSGQLLVGVRVLHPFPPPPSGPESCEISPNEREITPKEREFVSYKMAAPTHTLHWAIVVEPYRIMFLSYRHVEPYPVGPPFKTSLVAVKITDKTHRDEYK